MCLVYTVSMKLVGALTAKRGKTQETPRKLKLKEESERLRRAHSRIFVGFVTHAHAYSGREANANLVH
jgi:hypothetical protein